jgi:Flp pilus assembly protein TadD
MNRFARSRVVPTGRGLRLATAVSPVLIAIVTFIVFLPGAENPFVYWDDIDHLVNNPHYRGFSWHNIRWMFTTFHMGPYQPLSWLSLALDHAVWGMEPFGYHLTNVLLHSLNAVLFYWLTRRLLRLAMSAEGTTPWPIDTGAAVAALLFSIHPLRVESVAWATERRDVLCACFFLSALLAYLRAHDARQAGASSRRWMALTLVMAVMALLAKAVAVTLVAVMVVVDVYPLRRLGGKAGWLRTEVRPVWLEKIPFMVLTLAISVVAVVGQSSAAGMRSWSQYGPGPRMLVVLYGLSFYLVKTVWPAGLSPLYELPVDWSPADYRFALGGLAVLAAGVVFWIKRRRLPGLLAAWCSYVILLSPTLGFFQSGPQIAADRYTYLACMSWAVLVGAVVARFLRPAGATGLSRGRFAVVLGGALAAFSVLAVCTHRQIGVWSDSVRLWRRALTVDPNCYVAHVNLGYVLLETGKPGEALPWFERAVRLSPNEPMAHPYLGSALQALGRTAEARAAFRRALELNADDARAHYGLGLLLLQHHEDREAVSHLKRAVELKPQNAEARGYYGNALRRQKRLEDAAVQYQEAIELKPGEPGFYAALASTWADLRHYGDAEAVLRQGLKANPSDPPLADALAWLLATCPDARYRNGTEAVRLAESACRATDNGVPRFVATLAAACAEAGRFEQAVEKQRLAIELAEKQGRKDLATQLQSRLSSFARREPYHLSTQGGSLDAPVQR